MRERARNDSDLTRRGVADSHSALSANAFDAHEKQPARAVAVAPVRLSSDRQQSLMD